MLYLSKLSELDRAGFFEEMLSAARAPIANIVAADCKRRTTAVRSVKDSGCWCVHASGCA